MSKNGKKQKVGNITIKDMLQKKDLSPNELELEKKRQEKAEVLKEESKKLSQCFKVEEAGKLNNKKQPKKDDDPGKKNADNTEEKEAESHEDPSAGDDEEIKTYERFELKEGVHYVKPPSGCSDVMQQVVKLNIDGPVGASHVCLLCFNDVKIPIGDAFIKLYQKPNGAYQSTNAISHFTKAKHPKAPITESKGSTQIMKILSVRDGNDCKIVEALIRSGIPLSNLEKPEFRSLIPNSPGRMRALKALLNLHREFKELVMAATKSTEAPCLSGKPLLTTQILRDGMTKRNEHMNGTSIAFRGPNLQMYQVSVLLSQKQSSSTAEAIATNDLARLELEYGIRASDAISNMSDTNSAALLVGKLTTGHESDKCGFHVLGRIAGKALGIISWKVNGEATYFEPARASIERIQTIHQHFSGANVQNLLKLRNNYFAINNINGRRIPGTFTSLRPSSVQELLYDFLGMFPAFNGWYKDLLQERAKRISSLILAGKKNVVEEESDFEKAIVGVSKEMKFILEMDSVSRILNGFIKLFQLEQAPTLGYLVLILPLLNSQLDSLRKVVQVDMDSYLENCQKNGKILTSTTVIEIDDELIASAEEVENQNVAIASIKKKDDPLPLHKVEINDFSDSGKLFISEVLNWAQVQANFTSMNKSGNPACCLLLDPVGRMFAQNLLSNTRYEKMVSLLLARVEELAPAQETSNKRKILEIDNDDDEFVISNTGATSTSSSTESLKQTIQHEWERYILMKAPTTDKISISVEFIHRYLSADVTTNVEEVKASEGKKNPKLACPPLHFWEVNKRELPLLYRASLLYLLPGSSAKQERTFSTVNDIRSSMATGFGEQVLEVSVLLRVNAKFIDDMRGFYDRPRGFQKEVAAINCNDEEEFIKKDISKKSSNNSSSSSDSSIQIRSYEQEIRLLRINKAEPISFEPDVRVLNEEEQELEDELTKKMLDKLEKEEMEIINSHSAEGAHQVINHF